MALFVLLPLLPVPAAAADNSCGDNLTWSYSAGTLTITGSGDMYDYRDGVFAPWYPFRESIVKVSLPQGLTSIGEFAFLECENLQSVSIPDQVRSIGAYAFASCESLTSVGLGSNLQVLGTSAFHDCFALSAISLPYSLQQIGSNAFYRCQSLNAVLIPRNVISMGTSVFAHCTSLVRAEIDAPLTELPAWTFFGCTMLTEISLKETVKEIEENAFKECEILAEVHYPSENAEQVQKIENQIAQDVPSFPYAGTMSDTQMHDSTTGGKFEPQEDDAGVQTNITVWHNADYVLKSEVSRKMENGAFLNKYTVSLQLTLESQSAWDAALEQLKSAASSLKDYIGKDTYTIKVYLKNDAALSDKLIKLLAGADVKLEVMSATGSVWRVHCLNLTVKEDTIEAAPPPHDFSHTVQDASPEVKEQIGTDDCYELTFEESMDDKAEILVQLPPTTASEGSTAYLYQIEEDGEHTRLQATVVEQNGTAHFYLANTDKDTQYVIGVNVPNETVDDIIIPDELISTDRFSAIARLEEIEYVSTGKRELNGLGLGEIMMFTLVGLALTVVVVGVVMFFWNKKRLEQQNAMRRMEKQ